MRPSEKATLETLAESVLGHSNVATVTSDTLRKNGGNIEEIGLLVMKYNALPLADRRFEVKKSVGEPGDPTNFGLLLRRRE